MVHVAFRHRLADAAYLPEWVAGCIEQPAPLTGSMCAMASGDVYRRAAERVRSFVPELDEGMSIPATPAWTLRELVAHLCGVAVDVVAGNVSAYAQDAWTHDQVQTRRSRPISSVLDEWAASVDSMAGLMDDPEKRGLDPSFAELPLIDLLAHEHDIREASGLFDFVVPEVWPSVEARRRTVLVTQLAVASAPPLEVLTREGDRWLLGEGDIEATRVKADRYELWRSLEGRRTRQNVRQFEWSADPGPFLERWPGFVFRWVDDLAEDQPCGQQRLTGTAADRRAYLPGSTCAGLVDSPPWLGTGL
jgi:hypothetical protein